MIRKVDTSLDFQQREKDTIAFWEEKRIFEKSMQQRQGRPVFTFYDGPPTANGKPHVGHVITRVMKDLFPRYKTMKGHLVLRKAGWDTHGLPVELEVEKKLGLDGKPQIETYGVEPFIKQCKESVWVYKSEWERMTRRLGFWLDMENPYITYDNKYIESVWWSLKEIHKRGLLYHGHKVVPYCPRCGTALSSHEVAQGYHAVTDVSIYVKFPVPGEAGVYFLAWTTTPWTLPSNVGLVVNAKEEYVRVRVANDVYIMAGALVEPLFAGAAHEVLDRFPGQSLQGLRYEPLFPFTKAAAGEGAFKVCCDDYVTLTDGTGIVHCAPAFGEDDARVGNDNGLPFVQLVDTQGRFTPDAEPYAGQFVKAADPVIISDLQAAGLLLRELPYEHDYPFCWRCDTPLLYYARATWFIRMSALRDELVANNRSVNWLPENIKEGRMGNFLENVLDWGLSRERYWGTPLPVWTCGCGHVHVVGSIEELRRMGKNVPADIELHKPYIDAVHLTCPACGGDMTRVSEVIDCWYDSGSMPFAQWHYPFENKELFEQNFPADFISEAIDQTRGWFYSLLAIGTAVFQKSPYQNCIVLGHVQDKDGRKMSKHVGNVIDPWDVLNAQGADAVRWYFYSVSQPWLPSRVSPDLGSEAQRKFMGTLLNTYAFFALYAGIENFDPAKAGLASARLTLMDRWALSRLNTLVREVDEGLSAYKVTEPARLIADFVDELSNWYVRSSRERFWGKGENEDTSAAFQTLYHILVTLSRLIAPFVPFLAEQMHQNLCAGTAAPESVHLCDYPVCEKNRIDEALERDMGRCMQIVALGRSARAEAGLKIRQPLAALYVVGQDALPAELQAVAKDELNVKDVQFLSDGRAFTAYTVKPNLRTLGPRYGKILPKIGETLKNLDGTALVDELQAKGEVVFTAEGIEVRAQEADLLIEKAQREGYAAASDRGLTVALDCRLTQALVAEGYAREVVSKLQTMRKDAGLDVMDRIHVWYEGDASVCAAVAAYEHSITGDVLALALYNTPAPEGAYAQSWDINAKPMSLSLRKA